MTVAATLATAPLIAFHFGDLSTTRCSRTCWRCPRWRRRCGWECSPRRRGQVPGLPGRAAERAGCAAARLYRPGRGLVRPSGLGLPARRARARRPARLLRGDRRDGDRDPVPAPPPPPRRPARRAAPADGPKSRGALDKSARRLGSWSWRWRARDAGAWAAGWPALGRGGHDRRPARAGLRISVLDVGQGDAILLQPAGSAPLLVDAGPPDDGLAAMLRPPASSALGALVVTHDQSDHAGGVAELLGALPSNGSSSACRIAACCRRGGGRGAARGARGGRRAAIRRPSPRRALAAPELLGGSHAGEDPNLLALVMVARWRRFSMLLTADAEAESVPIDPGPIDVLKVAHHGSDDAALGSLLDRIRPRLAVISVGDGQPLRPSDRRDTGDAGVPRRPRPCAPTATGRS